MREIGCDAWSVHDIVEGEMVDLLGGLEEEREWLYVGQYGCHGQSQREYQLDRFRLYRCEYNGQHMSWRPSIHGPSLVTYRMHPQQLFSSSALELFTSGLPYEPAFTMIA